MLASIFDQDALLFTIPAIAGSAVFLVKLGLMSIAGIGADAEVDLSPDVDLGSGVDAGDSTEAFELLSVQSIAAFLMGFGWGGLGAQFGLDWGLPRSVALGFACGAALVWLLGLMLKAIYDLQCSGNVDVARTVGCDGTVYASVPGSGAGRGQVRVVVGERARIFDAVSEGEGLPTSTPVRVLRVTGDRTLVVAAP